MKEERFKMYCTQFMKSEANLQEVLAMPFSSVVQDAVIKRFEICWELGWKLGKHWLEGQGVVVQTPRATWQALLQAGVLQDGNRWSELQRLRNLTVHTYDLDLAHEVYTYLLAEGWKDFKALAERVQDWQRGF